VRASVKKGKRKKLSRKRRTGKSGLKKGKERSFRIKGGETAQGVRGPVKCLSLVRSGGMGAESLYGKTIIAVSLLVGKRYRRLGGKWEILARGVVGWDF